MTSSGEPIDRLSIALASAPIEGFHVPTTSSALFGLEAAGDSAARFLVMDSDGEPGAEIAGPFHSGLSSHLALSARADRIAFAAYRRVEVLGRDGEALGSIRLDDIVHDIIYVGDSLYVLTGGTGPREGILELVAFDPDGRLRGRIELPHRGQGGLLSTGAGALVVGRRDEGGLLVYSARCSI